jgi:hypothetical protein
MHAIFAILAVIGEYLRFMVGEYMQACMVTADLGHTLSSVDRRSNSVDLDSRNNDWGSEGR